MRLAVALTLAAACAVPAHADEAAPPSGSFAISGCRVITAAGDAIDDGVVVVKKGKIAEVGPREGTKVPRGVAVVDARGKVLTPAFVHVASRIGLRGSSPSRWAVCHANEAMMVDACLRSSATA